MCRGIGWEDCCKGWRDTGTKLGFAGVDVSGGFGAPFDVGVGWGALKGFRDWGEVTGLESRGIGEVGDNVPFAIGVEVAHGARVEVAKGNGTVDSCAIGVVTHICCVYLVEGVWMHGR